jgi:RimJ/RimL family protein N-acetyltransferase
VLRPWEYRDADVVLAAGLDRLISRYRYSLPRSADRARTWITATKAERRAGTRLELAVTEGGTPLGSVALAEIAHGNAMVRYWLLPDGRGRGLASRAVRLLAGWAFSNLSLGRLAAFIEPMNQASVAVLERCGFIEEGRLRQHMTTHDGTRVDTLLYGLLPEDLRS